MKLNLHELAWWARAAATTLVFTAFFVVFVAVLGVIVFVALGGHS